jgi:hypothetical protein
MLREGLCRSLTPEGHCGFMRGKEHIQILSLGFSSSNRWWKQVTEHL